MNIIPTTLPDVFIVEAKRYADARGWFSVTYAQNDAQWRHSVANFVQDNHSFSQSKGTLRGLHVQKNPKSQAKLVRCTRGAIVDVAVDLRQSSPTFSQHVAIKLSADNGRQLFIPKGFAHGFVTLVERTEVQYKVDDYYDANLERSIRYDDPSLAIDWGAGPFVLSYKDRVAPLLHQCDVKFE